jgi:predicted MFS family arabinose efflux permease
MVGREDVVNAVALHAAAFNAARVVGPATAGVLIAAVGLTPAFVINGLTAAVVAVALLRLRAGGTASGRAGPSLRQEIGEGLSYAVRTPLVRLVLGVLFVVTLTVFNFAVYIPLLARDVLHAGPQGYGFLMASLGLGAVAGALALGASRGDHPPPGVLLGSAAVSCAVLLLLAGVGRFASAVVALVVLGFASIITVAGANTTLQLTAPDHLRARVLSLHMLVFGGVFPLGAFLIGSLSEARGVRTAFLAAGGVGLAALGAISGWWARRDGSRPAGSAPP